MEAIAPFYTAASRVVDELELFASEMRPLTEAEIKQYARRTTKRPLLCFMILAALPFVVELACRFFAGH